MRTLFLTAALLSTVTLPAAATDLLPAKAPQLTPQAIINDWSGFYVGIAGGSGWGREKFDNPKTSIDNLFDTSAVSAIGNSPVLVQPGFTIPGDLSQKFKERGFVGGGFFGAQKQYGSWVLGIEADMYATGMKMSFQGDSSRLENITRIVPTSPLTIPAQTITVPAQTITIPAQDAPVDVTVGPQNVLLTATVGGFTAGFRIPAGSAITLTIFDGSLPGRTVTVITTADVFADANGKAVFTTNPNGNATVDGNNGPVTIGTTGGTGTGTAHVQATNVTIPAQNVTVPAQTITVHDPHDTTVKATVTRSMSMTSRIEELASVRGKIGLAASQNWMIYGTGGPAWAHVTRTLNISQTVAFNGDTPRTNSFSASTGETRLGFAIGAGLDWKLTPNLVLGALYLHYEFPKGTVTFADGSNSVGFGTSRQSADAITGRLSWMVPIH
jgi:opacity protein-like surface antigen